MKIKNVKFHVLDLGEKYAQWRGQSGVIELHTDEGLTGISRCPASSGQIIQERLMPLLVDRDPINTESLWQSMYRSVSNSDTDRGTVTAIGALDIALWDLKGKILGVPLHRLLGGHRDEIPAYADGAMFRRGPQGMAEWAKRFFDEGFRAVKYHVMQEGPEEVVETVRQIRVAVGSEINIMVDVHKAWQPHEAVKIARNLEEYDVYWLEEPIVWDDMVWGMGYLAANTRITVAAGESEVNIYRCRDLLQRGGIKVLQTDILSSGGYTAWLKMAALAEAFHATISPHGASYPELAAPLLAALPNGLIVSAFPAGQVPEIWSRLYQEPIKLVNGTIHLGEGPGLGVAFDQEFLSRYKI